jgi:O-antigen/teichoic acid export membrane protein
LRRLTGSGAIYVFGTIMQRGLSLLLLPVVTRVLTVDEYGLVGTAAALSALMAIVFGLGLNFSIVRFFYDEPRDARQTKWAALLWAQAAAGVVLALVVYATGPWWATIFPAFGWALAIKIAVGYALVSSVQSTVQSVLRAAQRPGMFFLTTMIQTGIGSALGIWCATRWGAAGYIAGLSVGSAAALGVACVAVYPRPRWAAGLIDAGLRLSLPAMVHQLSSWGIELADRLLIAVYLGAAEVGRYQIAYVLGSALTMLLTGIQAAWAPFFIGSLDADARRHLPSLMVVPVSIVAGFGCLIVVSTAPWLLAVVAPKSFGGTELIIALVASAAMARAAYFMAVVVLIDRRASGQMAIASLAGVVVNIGLNVALIPTAGLVAAAIATDLAVALQALLIIRAAERLIGLSMHIPRLCLVWLGGTGVLVASSVIPSTYVGDGVRVLVMSAGAIGAAVALSRLRTVLRGYMGIERNNVERTPLAAGGLA